MISEEEKLDMREATLEEGRAEGREEQRLEYTKAMLSRGIDMSVISEITGFSVEELEELRH